MVSIDAMTKDSGTAGDFVTADGSAGRSVTGSLSAALGAGEVLEVSVDGISWSAATVIGTAWSVTDNASHGGNWTIGTRIADAAGNVGGAASQGVILQAAPAQVVLVTAVADDVAPVSGNVANGGVTNDAAPVVSGTISASLGANEVLAVYRNGIKVGTASVSGAAWSYADSGLVDGASYSYTAVVENTVTAASGALSSAYIITVDSSAPAQVVTVVAMTKDSGTAGDFVTADGSAGRSVTGSLSAVLGAGEVLEVSVDGVSWHPATVSGTAWSITDSASHSGNWTISTRITDAAGNVGGAASRAVTLQAAPAQAATVTAVTDDVTPVDGIVADGGVTNDAAPVVSGTISSALGTNEVLAVYRNGVKIGIASVSGAAWSYADSGLVDGASYSYTAVVENTVTAASSTLSPAYIITVDTSAPGQVVTIDAMTKDSGTAGDFVTADGSAGRGITGTMSAVLDAGEALEISVDGVSWNPATVSGTAWSITDAASHVGNWTISTRIHDAAGNAGGAASQAVTLQAAPAQVALVTAVTDDVAPVSGNVAHGGVTNDAAPVVSGSISASLGTNEVLALYRNGVRAGTASVSGAAWSYADSALLDGASYSYTAVVENTVTAASGALSSAYLITVDTSAPAQVVTIDAMTKDSGSAGDFVTADGSAGRSVLGTLSAALGSGEVLEASMDGVSWNLATVSGTAWSTTDSASHGGNWTIRTRVTDAAGNVGGTASQAVTLLAAPAQVALVTAVTDDVAPVSGNVANGGVTNDAAPVVSGTVSTSLGANEVLAVYRNGVRVGTASVSGNAWSYADSGLLDGASYSYIALVENAVAGTSGAACAAYAFTVDTSAPAQVVTIAAMSRDSGVDGDFITADGTAGRSVRGSLSAALAQGEMLELSFDGGTNWVSAVVSGIEWTAIDGAMHSSGWTIESRITDGAGNVGGAATREVVLVATPAQHAVITAIADDTGKVTGNVSNGGMTDDVAPVVAGTISTPLAANEVLAIYRNAVRMGTASVSGTAWSFADAGLHDGATYCYTAQVENTVAGASGMASAAYTIKVDASAPGQVVSIVSMSRDSGVAGDFITADGGAGRSVAGTLSSPLAAGEVLELSFDTGVTWVAASVGGTSWNAVDRGAHSASWSISSRITDAAGNVGGFATRAVTLAPAPGQADITAVIDDVVGVTGAIVNGGVTNDASPLVTGSLSAPVLSGEVVAVYRNGEKIGHASVAGSSWTFQDSALADGASASYQARVENTLTAAVGGKSPAYVINIDTSAPAQNVTVVAMSLDTGEAGDFITSDGSAGRTLDGELSAPLAAGEVLEVSTDGGASWSVATVSSTAWQVIDSGAHSGSWTIATRVVDAAGNAGAVVTRPVVLAAEQLFAQPDPVPTAAPALEAPVAATVVPAPAASIASAPLPVSGVAGDVQADGEPLASGDLAPGEPLVSRGIPAPDMATAGLTFLQGPAVQSRFFEIDTGSNAVGTAGNTLALSGTDIGAGFTITVRQAIGVADAKDALRLVQAVVQIETGLLPDSDLLALSITSPNITALYDAASGTLTLSGIASAAEYEQVIQGDKLRDVTGADVKSKRTIRFTIRAESGQTQNGTKEYRGPDAVPEPPPGTTERGIPVTEAARPGKPGLMSQLAKAQARQTEGRDKLLSLAAARQRG